MKITFELKADLAEAVEDKEMLEKVIEVIERHAVVDTDGVKRVPVKYIGKKDNYSDGLFDTGIWSKGVVKMVSYSVAQQMLVHKDVYVEGKEEESVDVVDVDEQKKEEDEQETRLTEARNMIQNMSRKVDVEDFVANNYNGLKIPGEFKKLAEMKEFAISHVDRFGLV